MNDRARPVPQWVWVVASIVLIAGLALATCAVGVGVLAPRRSKSAAKTESSADPAPLHASDDDFVMVTADRSQEPADIFAGAVVTATARGLKPFVYATASWCSPCKKLDASLTDPRMKDAFKGTYVVKLDIDEFEEKTLGALGIRVHAVPSFFELGEGGAPTGRAMIGGDPGPDVPENMAPALKRFFSVPATGR